eukprot:jgi/Mesvir1/19435/Mv10462-RA.1
MAPALIVAGRPIPALSASQKRNHHTNIPTRQQAGASRLAPPGKILKVDRKRHPAVPVASALKKCDSLRPVLVAGGSLAAALGLTLVLDVNSASASTLVASDFFSHANGLCPEIRDSGLLLGTISGMSTGARALMVSSPIFCYLLFDYYRANVDPNASFSELVAVLSAFVCTMAMFVYMDSVSIY